MGRFFWKLYATYLIAVALCAVVVGWYAMDTARSLYLNQVESDLQSQAQLVDQQVTGLIGRWDGPRIEALVHTIGWASGATVDGETSDRQHTRITVIAPDGVVIADSELPAAALENHASRPEVRAALDGTVGRAIRKSATLNEQMMYVAIPAYSADHKLVAVIRTAIPMTDMQESLGSLYRRIIIGASVVALAVALMGLLVSRRISGQMRIIREGATRFASGDLARRLPVPDSAEIGSVAESLNEMAEQLNATIETITRERNEREAILSSMVEGVVAVDNEERVITLNDGAAALLDVTIEHAQGRGIHEVVRNVELQRFVATALSSERPVESEIALRIGLETRYLQANGARLHTETGESVGAVVALNDVTRLKHLERVRSDFVANVSHEIKTPVTSIKGFAETLAEGALEDPDDARRFLQIIVRQADRLNAIIEDLLSLSRLESEQDGGLVTLERVPLADVLRVAVEVCSIKAKAKHIEVTVDCPPDLVAAANPALLEQAVINLIDNAIKYSPDGESVAVDAARDEHGVVISVRDRGIGIEREHLERLFERFYRVDKARSRDLGGTGLGLAIVKHIAQAQGGSVTVESVPGVGSTFRIHLPD